MAIFERVARGALAGMAGSVAMTALMNPGVARWLPRRYRPDEWVPRQVIQWMEEVAGAPDAFDEETEQLAATAAHLGYGATMGALYGLLRTDRGAIPAASSGAVWGLLVWAAGYEGWMPAVGVRPPMTHEPVSRWPLPVANHLVFGVVTALAYEDLERRSRGRYSLRVW